MFSLPVGDEVMFKSCSNITMTNDQCLLLDHGVSNFKLGHVLKVYIASSFPVSTKSKSRNLHCNVLTLPVPFSDKESKLT